LESRKSLKFQCFEIGGKLALSGGTKNGSTGEIGASGSFSAGSGWCNLLALSFIVCQRIKSAVSRFSISAKIRAGVVHLVAWSRGAGAGAGAGGMVLVLVLVLVIGSGWWHGAGLWRRA
jgi:hypothetical protein